MNISEIKGCILFSTADWDAPYWTNKQHTTKLMAENNIKVLYVESIGLRQPKFTSVLDVMRILRRLRRGFRGVTLVKKNIYIFSPMVVPFFHWWGPIKWFNGLVTKTLINRFVNINFSYKDKLVIWTYHPYALDLISSKYNYPIVYHCVDDLTSIKGIDAKNFRKIEEIFAKKVNVIFATSIELYNKQLSYNPNAYYYSNVVDFLHFSQAHFINDKPEDIVHINSPIIGYVGALTDLKIDFDLLYELALSNEYWQFVMIGDEPEGQANQILKKLKLLKNVHLLGYRPYQSLPSYLRFFDVALFPTCINSYTNSMFPMKYFEYLAAGIPIVSTPLSFLSEEAGMVEVGVDAADFAGCIRKQLDFGKISYEEAKLAVGTNTWEVRLNNMIEAIPEK